MKQQFLYKERGIEGLVVLMLGALAAIVSGVLFFEQEQSKVSMMTSYFMYQYDYNKLQLNQLMYTVIGVRLPILLVAMLGNVTQHKRKLHAMLYFGYSFAIFYTLYALITLYDVGGVVFFLGLSMPHLIFYLFSLYKIMRNREGGWKGNVGWSVIFILGMLLEVCVNPQVMSLVLRIM